MTLSPRASLTILLAALSAATGWASDGSTVLYDSATTVSASNVCKVVTNSSATLKSVYVPTATTVEWSGFYNNLPDRVTTQPCCTLGAPVTTDPGTIYWIWSDGSGTIFVNDGGANNLRAYTFNGTLWVNTASISTGNFNYATWGDGTYLYVANDTTGLKVYSFNGVAFTDRGTHSQTGSIAVWGSSGYIYGAFAAAGVRALSFNGTTFTNINTYNTPGNAYGVWSKNNGATDQVFVADRASGIRALTFNGVSLTSVATYATTDAYGIWGDGTYIYVADGAGGIRAFSFNGSAFTLLDTVDTPGTAYAVWSDGTDIYVADGASGVRKMGFNGYTLSTRAIYNTAGTAYAAWADSNYLYYADGTSGQGAQTMSCP